MPATVVHPIETVVSVDDFKAIYTDTKLADSVITSVIKAGESAAQLHLNRAVPRQTRRIWLHVPTYEGPLLEQGTVEQFYTEERNEYPLGGVGFGRRVEIEPFISLKVSSFRDDNTEEVLEPKLTIPEDGYIEFEGWLTGFRRKYAVKIDYVAGWSAADVPPAVKEFVLRLAGELMNFNRPVAKAYKFPENVQMIADDYRRPKVGAGGQWRTW